MIYIAVLILGIAIISIITGLIFSSFEKKTRRKLNEMPNVNSEIKIDIKEKLVYKRQVNKSIQENETYQLDDFIYMVSLNPDSKNFREFLKLINNGASFDALAKKKKTLDSIVPFYIKYSDNKKTLALANLADSLEEDYPYVVMQISETIIPGSLNENNYLDNKFETFEDHEIFSKLTKEVKNIRTKGWVLLLFYPNFELLPTTKEHLVNHIQLFKIKSVLEEQGINSFLSNNGELFAVVPASRNSDHFNIQKQWINKYSLTFNNSKKQESYLDIIKPNIGLKTAAGFSKETKEIDVVFTKIILLSYTHRDSSNNKKEITNIFMEAAALNAQSKELLNAFKDKKPPIKSIEHVVIERGVKPIIEYFVDYKHYNFDYLIKHSISHKRKMLESLYKLLLKEADKFPNQIVTFSLDISIIDEVINLFESIGTRKNLYITLDQKGYIRKNSLWREKMKRLEASKPNIILLIRKQNSDSISFINNANPKVILVFDSLGGVYDEKNEMNINLKTIDFSKLKSTKIYTIK